MQVTDGSAGQAEHGGGGERARPGADTPRSHEPTKQVIWETTNLLIHSPLNIRHCHIVKVTQTGDLRLGFCVGQTDNCISLCNNNNSKDHASSTCTSHRNCNYSLKPVF